MVRGMVPGFAKAPLRVVAALTVLAALFLTQWRQLIPPKNDFLQFYVGAKLIGSGSYFSKAAFAELQRALIPGLVGQFLPVHPPFESILLWPLALFSLNAAFVVFECLCFVAVGVFLAVLFKTAPELPLYVAFSLPILFALINGQDVVLLLAPLALALRCGGKRPFLAGMILSLCAIKFHLFLALPIALVAQKRWRILQGLAAGLPGSRPCVFRSLV